MVKLNLTHELCPEKQWLEIRFNEDDRLESLKKKVSLATGSDPHAMRLQLFDKNNEFMGMVDSSLAAMKVENGYRMHVIDDDPNSILRDSGQTMFRFQISEEDYNKRSGTAREFLRNLARDHPERFIKTEREKPDDLVTRLWGVTIEKIMNTGLRCKIKNVDLYGTCRWVGYPSPELCQKLNLNEDRCYAGVQLDSNFGVFNGCDGSTTLFACSAEEGACFPVDELEIGNFEKKIDSCIDGF